MGNAPLIVGIDEAGRGALAGPVVAGACLDCPELHHYDLIRDSKKLTNKQRDKAYQFILDHCICGVGIEPAETVEAEGILGATEKAMLAALSKVEEHVVPTTVFVDGRDHFWFPYPKTGIIKGDEKERCIAAASILAKVTRDRLMIEHDTTFPEYGFKGHKGYGTAEHFAAIKKHGQVAIHRASFIHEQPNS